VVKKGSASEQCTESGCWLIFKIRPKQTWLCVSFRMEQVVVVVVVVEEVVLVV